MRRNLSIDLMRVIAAILVVIIHTAPFSGIHPLLTYSIHDVLPRIAVPFFFAISGYYFINSSSKKQLKQILSVARDYIVVSAVYIVFKILFSLFTNKQLQISLFGFIFNFFTAGIEYHLWFFPALIYSMVFFYLWNIIFKNKVMWLVLALSFVLFFIGILGCSYYDIGIKVPGATFLFNNTYFEMIRRIFMFGFVFFASGHLAISLNQKYDSSFAIKALIIFLLLFIIEIYILYFLKIYSTVVITLFLYPLTVSLVWYLVSNPKYKNYDLSKYCKDTSTIMYYYHPIILSILYLFNNNGTLNFFIVVTVFIIAGLIKSNIIKVYKFRKEKEEKSKCLTEKL